MTGWAVLTVSPDADGATIHWREDAGFRAAGNLLDWPNRVAGRRVFGKLVDRLLDDTPRLTPVPGAHGIDVERLARTPDRQRCDRSPGSPGHHPVPERVHALHVARRRGEEDLVGAGELCPSRCRAR